MQELDLRSAKDASTWLDQWLESNRALLGTQHVSLPAPMCCLMVQQNPQTGVPLMRPELFLLPCPQHPKAARESIRKAATELGAIGAALTICGVGDGTTLPPLFLLQLLEHGNTDLARVCELTEKDDGTFQVSEPTERILPLNFPYKGMLPRRWMN